MPPTPARATRLASTAPDLPRAEAPTSQLFARAAARLSDIEPEATQEWVVLPASALTDLPPEQRPQARFLQGRSARPHSAKQYAFKANRTIRLLHESGFPEGDANDPESFPWHRITPEHAATFRRHLVDRYPKPKSSSAYISTIRRMIRECGRAGLLNSDQRDLILDELRYVGSATQERTGRALTDADLAGIFAGAASNRLKRMRTRNLAILTILLSTGLRAGETCDLDLSDYQPNDHSFTVRHTKSSEPRRAWLNDAAVQALQAWLELRGDQPGPLFPGHLGNRLDTNGVGYVVITSAQRGNVNGKVGSHDFRRTFITRLLEAGTDPFLVAKLVGHKKVSTTLIYDRRGETELRNSVRNLELPSPPKVQS